MRQDRPAEGHIFPGCGTFEWYPDADRLIWGAGLPALFGRPEADGAQAFFAAVHPGDRDALRAGLETAFRQGGSFEHEIRIRLPDGRARVLLGRGGALRDDAGRIIGVAGIETDVTRMAARSEAVDPLAAIGAALDTLFENAPAGLGIWDRELRFVKVNALLAEMNGLPAAAHVGHTARELLPDVADIDGIEAMFRRILDTGEAVRDIEVSGTTPACPSQTRYWREHFFPVRAGGEICGVAALAEDITETRHAQARAEVLLHELNHRSKNLVSLILAICRQTARHQPQDFLKVFQARLESMSAAQDLLIRQNWQDIGLEALIRSQLPHVEALIGGRIMLAGDPAVVIPAEAAQSLALAFHELTTNSAKYGALSGEAGRLDVIWAPLPGGGLEVSWRESGGPAVTPPKRKGFGSSLTGALLQSTLGAEIDTEYAPAGLIWRLRMPAGPVPG